MKRRSFPAAACLAVAAACAPSVPPRAAPADAPAAPAATPAPTPAAPVLLEEGTSVDSAVIVPAKDERSGVDWEYDWIYRHYGRFRKKRVALASKEGRRYDVMTVEFPDHTERVFYFDITGFFGK